MLVCVTPTSLAVLTLHVVTWNLAEEKAGKNRQWGSVVCCKLSVVVKELWQVMYVAGKLVNSTGLCRYYPLTTAL